MERSSTSIRFRDMSIMAAGSRNLATVTLYLTTNLRPNVDPRRGLGRTLFAALAQLARAFGHPELASAKLILLGFSGTGSLVARMTEYAPDRVIASIPTHAGHFDPVGMDTVTLSRKAAGSADAVSGGGQNWSVSSALIQRRLVPPQVMIPAGWLPTDAFSQHWNRLSRSSNTP
jgi:hypothetical protein